MSGSWSNATAGVWAGKLGGLGSDPREGSEWCHCSSCARPTTMTGTKLCDRCWERRRYAPEADDLKKENRQLRELLRRCLDDLEFHLGESLLIADIRCTLESAAIQTDAEEVDETVGVEIVDEVLILSNKAGRRP